MRELINGGLTALSPRARLRVAVLLLLGLALLGPLGGLSVVSLARWLLALGALGGVAWWWRRREVPGAHVARVERMQVISRAGLSPRCGLALVEVEGRGFLVAFGDSFAEVHALREGDEEVPPVFAQARRPRTGRRMRGASKAARS